LIFERTVVDDVSTPLARPDKIISTQRSRYIGNENLEEVEERIKNYIVLPLALRHTDNRVSSKVEPKAFHPCEAHIGTTIEKIRSTKLGNFAIIYEK
jgi:hypothetical protein